MSSSLWTIWNCPDRWCGILDHILNGMAVILLSTDGQYVIVNLKRVEHRPVTAPEITYTIRGPRDCFVENLNVNLSLIRYRFQDPNLRIEMMQVGRRTKTGVAVIYMEDIANDAIVAEVKKRIDAIDIDAIWGTSELQHFLQGSKHALFPQLGTTERSDWACEAVVEGRVVILADGGHIALMAPQTFGEFMTACDDRYDNKFMGLFSHIIRFFALFIMLCMSSLYIAVVSYHSYVLVFHYTIMLAQLRQDVLFSPLIEVLILELLVELIRESMLRVPQKIGAAVGIVGAIVIGQAGGYSVPCC
jgi:spore germination protein KA